MKIPDNFIRLSNDLFLCNECKILGYCKVEQLRQNLQEKLHGIPKSFTFKDYAKYIPIQSFNGSYGAYTNKHLQLGCDAFHQEDYETAFIHFKAALEARSNIDFVYLALALCCFKMNDFEMALLYNEYKANQLYYWKRTPMDEYFATLCEIGLKEQALQQQAQKLHGIDLNAARDEYLVNDYL